MDSTCKLKCGNGKSTQETHHYMTFCFEYKVVDFRTKSANYYDSYVADCPRIWEIVKYVDVYKFSHSHREGFTLKRTHHHITIGGSSELAAMTIAYLVQTGKTGSTFSIKLVHNYMCWEGLGYEATTLYMCSMISTQVPFIHAGYSYPEQWC